MTCPAGYDCDYSVDWTWYNNNCEKCGYDNYCSQYGNCNDCDDTSYCSGTYECNPYDCWCDENGENCDTCYETCWCDEFDYEGTCNSYNGCSWWDQQDCYCSNDYWQWCGWEVENNSSSCPCESVATDCNSCNYGEESDIYMSWESAICEGYTGGSGNDGEGGCENGGCYGKVYQNVTPRALLDYCGYDHWQGESCIKDFEPYWKCSSGSNVCGCSDVNTWCEMINPESEPAAVANCKTALSDSKCSWNYSTPGT